VLTPFREADSKPSLPGTLPIMSDAFESGARPVWIASYPRSGNTFLRIILQNVFRLPSYSLYRVEGENHRDPSAEALEHAPFLPRNWRELISNDAESKPVLIKTHEPPCDEAQAIYLVRDGRAAIQSYYHYHQKYAFERPSLLEIIAGACQFGSWSQHYLGWQPKKRPRTMLIRYEELVASPATIIPVLAEFLKIRPTDGYLPSFQELQGRQPEFFRRGNNADFYELWAPPEMALFNQLHGAVAQDLGYLLAQASDSGNVAALELARSAARLHRQYQEQLSKLGLAAASQNKLADEVITLSDQLNRISNKLAEREKLLKRRWVRLGVAMRAMQAVDFQNGD